jgi:glycosyltransferase involved in cell wall biosynthesis
MTVLVVAELGRPPYVGGIENVVHTLIHSRLGTRYAFEVFDTHRAPDPRRRWWTRLQFGLAVFVNCGRRVLSCRPVLVHIHTASRISFWKHSLCLLAARLAFRRTVFHLHGGSFDTVYEGYGRGTRLLVRWVFRLPDVIVVLSEYWKDFLSGLTDSGRIRVVPNPIDCDSFALSATGEPPKAESAVLLMGSLGKRKGHYDVLRAVPRVRERHPRVLFLFAGNEEDPGAEAQLQRIVAEQELAPNVRLLGPVGGAEKLQLLQTASVLILPSYGENMPVSVLEGMAAGLPVVTTRVGALPEAIEEGSEGYLIEPGDWEALAERINRLLDDRALARSMGAAARRKARERWDVGGIASRLEEIYQELL